MEKREKFFISEYKILINNLNKVSDHLLRVKWFYLATLAALGTSYIKALEINCYNYNGLLFIFITCLIGNIIFWIICEYVISHGFLYRYIQSKAAQKEFFFHENNNNFNKMEKFIKDPTRYFFIKKIDEHGKVKELFFDHLLPDQFVPIYWACLFIIVMNTLFTISLIIYRIYTYNQIYSKIYIITFSTILALVILFSMLLLLFKIISYYIYKAAKFNLEFCDYKINIKLSCGKKCQFFSFPNITGKYDSKFNNLFFPIKGIIRLLKEFLNPFEKKTEAHFETNSEKNTVELKISQDKQGLKEWSELLIYSVFVGGLEVKKKINPN